MTTFIENKHWMKEIQPLEVASIKWSLVNSNSTYELQMASKKSVHLGLI